MTSSRNSDPARSLQTRPSHAEATKLGVPPDLIATTSRAVQVSNTGTDPAGRLHSGGWQFQILRLWAGFGSVGYLPLELCRAQENDHDVIVGLIEAAAGWLRRTKDTDQWTQPWRNEEDRSNRIRRDLAAGKTWMLRDSSIAVATITADPEDYPIWPGEWRRQSAVYVRRLVVSRDYAGRRLGASLLDWAGLTARRRDGTRWIRVDVWRTNKALHGYYERQGFVSCGLSSDPDYPSGALFQKSTQSLQELHSPLFHEV